MGFEIELGIQVKMHGGLKEPGLGQFRIKNPLPIIITLVM